MKKPLFKKIIMISMVCMLASTTVLTACGHDSYTADDLQRARIKRANGEKLNREDSNMLNGFDKWKAENDKYADY